MQADVRRSRRRYTTYFEAKTVLPLCNGHSSACFWTFWEPLYHFLYLGTPQSVVALLKLSISISYHTNHASNHKTTKHLSPRLGLYLCLFLLWRLPIHFFTLALLFLFRHLHLLLHLNFQPINTITPSWCHTARTGRIVSYGLVPEFEQVGGLDSFGWCGDTVYWFSAC